MPFTLRPTTCKCAIALVMQPTYLLKFDPGCARCAACVCAPYAEPPGGVGDPWSEYHALNSGCRYCYPVDGAAGRKRDKVRRILEKLRLKSRGGGVRTFVYDF